MTNDHFSILNFQFTSKDRWPSSLMQPQQNLTCLQRLLVFTDSSRGSQLRCDPPVWSLDILRHREAVI
jgi:hypothetical protein